MSLLSSKIVASCDKLKMYRHLEQSMLIKEWNPLFRNSLDRSITVLMNEFECLRFYTHAYGGTIMKNKVALISKLRP